MRAFRLLSAKGAKASISDDRGVHQLAWHGVTCASNIDAAVYSFGETYAIIKAVSFPGRKPVLISTGQCQTSFCMSYNSMTS